MAKTFETYQYVNPIVVRMKESEKGIIYKSVVAMGMRSRQINDYIKFELNERLADVIDLNAETDVANYDQILISKEFDNIPKPTFIAMREIMDDKLKFEEKSIEND